MMEHHLYTCEQSNEQRLKGILTHYASWNGRLHQQQLEELFGPITPHLMQGDNDNTRVVHLEDRNGTSRTYAIAFFTEESKNNKEIEPIDKKIRAGGGIGETFIEDGCNVARNFLAEVTARPSEILKSRFGQDDMESWEKMFQSHPDLREIGKERLSTYIKGQISEFYAKKGDSILVYVTLVEFLPPYIRPVINPGPDSNPGNDSHIPHYYGIPMPSPLIIGYTPINPSTERLQDQNVGFSRKEIWKRIKKGNDWSDVQMLYNRAKHRTLPAIEDIIVKTNRLSAEYC